MPVPNNNGLETFFVIWKKIEFFKYMNELGLARKLTNTFVLYKYPQLSGWFNFPAQLGFFLSRSFKS